MRPSALLLTMVVALMPTGLNAEPEDFTLHPLMRSEPQLTAGMSYVEGLIFKRNAWCGAIEDMKAAEAAGAQHMVEAIADVDAAQATGNSDFVNAAAEAAGRRMADYGGAVMQLGVATGQCNALKAALADYN